MKQETKTNETFQDLAAAAYQLKAEDAVIKLLGPLMGSDIFSRHISEAKKVRGRKEFERFISTLPSGSELEEKFRQQIKNDYSKIQDSVLWLEKERDDALKDPKMDYSLFGVEWVSKINSRLRKNIHFATRSKADVEVRLDNLGEVVSGVIREKLKQTGKNKFRQGDILKVVDLAGFDSDEGKRAYYYGGDESDIPLESTVELLDFASKDRICILYTAGEKQSEWQLHPDEVKKTGKNTYEQLVRRFRGNIKKAAAVVIKEAEDSLMQEYRKKAIENINLDSEIKISRTFDAMQKKYGLNDEQINALRKGQEFSYEPKGIDAKADIHFEKLLALAAAAIGSRTGKEREIPKDRIKNEAEFVKKARKITDLAIEKDVIASLVPLLEKQHYLKEREIRIRGTNEDVTETTLDYLLRPENQVWLRRLLLYNDKNLYKGGDPFSPPSEELPRVIKLETGNGCNYAKCTFCTEYAKAKFFVRSPEEFRKHAEEVRKRLGNEMRYIQRVFLSGGNIFSLPTKTLVQYLKTVDRLFNNQHTGFFDGTTNHIRRVEAFTRTEGILRKPVEELRELERNNLKLLYWGIETGAEEILNYVNKGITRAEMDEAGEKIKKTDIMLSVMLMPGLGGIKHYEQFVKGATDIVNKITPRYVTFHTVTPRPNTAYAEKMNEEMKKGKNRPLTDEEVVEQIYDVVSGLNDGYRSLVATYYPPAAKIAINPISFRGYFNLRGHKQAILDTLTEYFRNGRVPGNELPKGAFNENSAIRKIAREKEEQKAILAAQ